MVPLDYAVQPWARHCRTYYSHTLHTGSAVYRPPGVVLLHIGFVAAVLRMDFVVAVESGRSASACHNCRRILRRRPPNYHNKGNSYFDLLELTLSSTIHRALTTWFQLTDTGEGLSKVQYTWQDHIISKQIS